MDKSRHPEENQTTQGQYGETSPAVDDSVYPEDNVDRLIREFGEAIKTKFLQAKISELVLALTSVALMFVGVGQLFVAWKSYHDTTPLVDYARDASKAAKDFSESAKKIDEGVRRATGNLGSQAQVLTDTYETEARPYLAIDGIPTHIDRNNKNLGFNANLKNYGSIPAFDVRFEWKIFIDGVQQTAVTVPFKPNALQPGALVAMPAGLGPTSYKIIVADKKPLDLYIRYSYKWRNHVERNCIEEQYDPNVNNFLDLGPLCGSWDTIASKYATK
jgi:hypothetical protein